MTPDERQWFAELPRGAIFNRTRAALGWSAFLDEQPPRYAAQLKVEATLTPGLLVESYLIRCRPESAPIERCLVHFTQARPEPPRWADGPAQPRFAAQRWSAERQSKAGFEAGETWELVFANLQSGPFEIRATRSTELTGDVPVGLVSLPEADSQQGILEVRALDGAAARLTNRRLKPLPLETVSESQYPTLRGAFSYDPAGELGLPAGDALLVSRPASIDELSGAVIWDLQLDSRYQSDGRGLHLARCRIESSGRPRCSLTMPAGCRVLGAWVDDDAVPWTSGDGKLSAPLPPGKRFPTLEVQFATEDSPLAAFSGREAPWPTADAAVLSRHWSLWAPPGYDLLGRDQNQSRHTELSWSQRLFGILGRPLREGRFDPSFGENWLPVVSAGPREVAGVGPADAGRNLGQSLPWTTVPRAGSRSADSSGWREFLLSPADEVSRKVYLVDRATMLAAGWATMALVFACGRWLLRGRFAVLTCLAGVLATTAMLAPAACSPVASGALLAALACLALEVLAPQNPRRANGAAAPRSAPLAPAEALSIAAILGTAALGAALSASLACAQDAESSGKAARPDRVYRVLIPSDADGKPRAGAKYQIPQVFRAELRERAMAATGEPRGWLLRDANYRARLGRGDGEARVEVSDFTVQYRLHVFSANTRVRLPISRLRAGLSPDSAVLDGQPVELEWEDGGQALLCDISEPGSYQLEFKLLPVITASLEHDSLELSLPSLPAATLTLDLPDDLTGVEISGALGPVTWSADRASATAKLGPTSRLAVRWPQTIGGAQPNVEVEELLWLKVRPGSVVVDAMLQYQVSGGQVRQVELAADPRLRLIPPAPDSPIAQYRTSFDASDMADNPQTIQLDLSQPLTDQLSLPLSLLLTETSGIGNLRLPLLKVLGAHSRRRWLAVSVDSGLEVAVRNDENLERVDAADFSNKWGKTDLQPLLAYRLPPGDSPWNLATRPRQPHTTVKQVLALSFQRGGALVDYDAELMTTAGYCFQHRLLVPPALEIDSISLQADDGAERLQRWARDDEGMANVFLSARTTGPQRLSVRGRLTTPDNGAFSLPAIHIEGGDPLPQEDVVRVFRQPAVLVSLADLKGLAEIAGPSGEDQPEDFGRPVASFAAAARDFSAMVSVSANEPLVDRVQVTSLEYENKRWRAEIEHRLNVERGLVDALRFEIPKQWTGPFEISPSAAAEVVEDAALGRTQLIVRPRTALGAGRHRLTIRGPLDLGEDAQVMAPDIRSLQPGHQERFIVLPTQVGVEHVTWDAAQLVPADLPEGFATPFVSPEAFEVYRVAGEKPHAVLNPLERSSEMAKVRLADIQWTWTADGECQAAASFDLEPTGLSSCPLRLPPDWRLLRLSAAGAAVTPTPVEGGWELPLGANRLPQRIEVVASGRTSGSGALWNDVQLPAPALGDLPVEQTLWTLYAPAGWKSVEMGTGAVPIDAFAYEGYRLKSIAAIVNNLSSDMAATTPPAELLNWRRAWLRRLVSSKHSLDRRRLDAAGDHDGPAPFDAGVLEQEWSQISQNLDLSPLLGQLSAQSPIFDQSSELWDQVHARDATATRFLVHRDGPAPRARMIRTGEAGLLDRLGACGVIVLASSLLLAAARRGIPVELARRWPHVLGVAAGIAWWLWLSPSIVGCLIVAASVAAALRPQLRPAREPVSAITQLGSLKR
jgi:hypothetical protein